jgi:hypothetical protein
MVKTDPAARLMDGVTDNLGQLSRYVFGRHFGSQMGLAAVRHDLIIQPKASWVFSAPVLGVAYA